MPLFAFQIGIGFNKTNSKFKYILRMFVCALISEIPFLLMLNNSNLQVLSINGLKNLQYTSLNICFTFFFALTALYFIDMAKKNPLLGGVALLPILLSAIIPMDYGIYAVALVILSYFFNDKKILFTISMIILAITYYNFNNSSLQIYMLFAIPLIWFYNGKKGKSFKYYFYAFYPLHMLIITLIHLYLT